MNNKDTDEDIYWQVINQFHDSMICIHVQYQNMNPVRAGMGVCVFYVCEFEYVSV